jgi:GNAT superfamily N-acetyltransferase
MYNDLTPLYGGSPTGDFPPLPFSAHNGYLPTFVIAWMDGHPVACGAIVPLEDGVAEVKRMYVAREWRRLGIARRILADLENRALGLGYHTLRLETGIRQPEAIGLYETSGYRHIPLFGQYQGGTLSVCFEKSLR